ncbi:MAG: diphthine--ammonia ligase [archaeon]|nr:diphthine--ammonia ligase [archaeon]
MKLAALFSGGKDSMFALYIAKQMGHEIKFLVNIIPSNEASWLFHTPNLNMVPKMAMSMGIPLIRVKSDGTENGDINSLKCAIKGLKVDGIVIGSLWSDYQWDRMNTVFDELHLKTIAPLWRKNQDTIYDEIISAGIDAIIVGTFAYGFNEDWLGKHLDLNTKKELISLRRKYGVSIMGEGGEYESMVLDSPMYKKKLIINKYEKKYTKYSGTLTVKESSF